MKGKKFFDRNNLASILQDIVLLAMALGLSDSFVVAGTEWKAAYVIGITAATFLVWILCRKYVVKLLVSVGAIPSKKPADHADKAA